MDIKHIPVVLGTARIGRESEAVAKAVVDIIENQAGYSTELVDVRDHVTAAVTVPPWGEGGADENPTRWKEVVKRSHALILVAPEYNHSFPGELKLLLDSLTSSYEGKSVGLVGVSGGTLGAARMMDHIRPVLNTLNLHVAKNGVHVSKAERAVGDDGLFVDESVTKRVVQVVSETVALATALQSIED